MQERRNLFGYVDAQVSVHAGVHRSTSARVNANLVSVDPRAADLLRLLEGDRLERIQMISEVT